MNKIFAQFFNLLIPIEDGFYTGLNTYFKRDKIEIKSEKFAGGYLFYLYDYDFNMKNLFIKLKKGGEYSIALEMGQVLGNHLKNQNFDLVLFSPSDPKRLLQRGFNVPKIISQEIVNKLSTVYLDVFKKKKTTKNSSKSNLKNRLQNDQNTYLNLTSEDEKKLKNAKNILIVDDVSTTGATLLDLRNTLSEKIDTSQKNINFAVICKTQKK